MAVDSLPEEAPAPRLCHLIKWDDFDGYGFNLHAERSNPGQFIGKIDDESPAQMAGLREGDRIIEVNGVNINNENHRQVVERIKSNPDEAKLLVVDPQADLWYREHDFVVKSSQINVVYVKTPVPRPQPGSPRAKFHPGGPGQQQPASTKTATTSTDQTDDQKQSNGDSKTDQSKTDQQQQGQSSDQHDAPASPDGSSSFNDDSIEQQQQQQQQREQRLESPSPPSPPSPRAPMSPDSGRGDEESARAQPALMTVEAEINRQTAAIDPRDRSRKQQVVEEVKRQMRAASARLKATSGHDQDQPERLSLGVERDDQVDREDDDCDTVKRQVGKGASATESPSPVAAAIEPDSLQASRATEAVVDAKERARQVHNRSADSGKSSSPDTATRSASSGSSSSSNDDESHSSLVGDSLEDREQEQVSKPCTPKNDELAADSLGTAEDTIPADKAQEITTAATAESFEATGTGNGAHPRQQSQGGANESSEQRDKVACYNNIVDGHYHEHDGGHTLDNDNDVGHKAVPCEKIMATSPPQQPSPQAPIFKTIAQQQQQQQQQQRQPQATTGATNNNYSGLNLNMTASQMRELISSRKKFDPKKASMDIRQKYEIIQQM